VSNRAVPFVKGHGTENDFVLIPDADGLLDVTAEAVARICDRHAGLGADGVLRVVRSAAHPDAAAMAAEAEWFMDYRNADGSLSEMCGNGARVFARHLIDAGWAAPGDWSIATRGGIRPLHIAAEGDVTIDMGPYDLPARGELQVLLPGGPRPATAVSVPNPHAVVLLDDGETLDAAGELATPPGVEPRGAFPDGVNVEIVVRPGPCHIAMRVHERGSGETRSCGTGACAAAVVAAERDGAVAPVTYRVDVPGGVLAVRIRVDGHVELTGPAVIVARGEFDARWLGAGATL
jgi:diaminopimelate epimerase